MADDADSPEFSVLVYSLPDDLEELDQNQNPFHINSQTGELCVSGDIDRDGGQSVHNILVRAEDPVCTLIYTFTKTGNLSLIFKLSLILEKTLHWHH